MALVVAPINAEGNAGDWDSMAQAPKYHLLLTVKDFDFHNKAEIYESHPIWGNFIVEIQFFEQNTVRLPDKEKLTTFASRCHFKRKLDLHAG